MAQKIIVALSIEIRDAQGKSLIDFLNKTADAGKGSVWTYPKGAGAKATFEVEVVFTMAEFAKALDTEGAYVVYNGHSRYGQGPAFGPPKTPHVPDAKTFPVNPWGVHFRMGFDATDTECIGDLFEHSVTPTEFDLVTAPAKAFLPTALETAATNAKDADKTAKRAKTTPSKLCPVPGAWRSLDICDGTLAARKTARGDQPLKGRHYYRHNLKPTNEYLTAVQVGSADLDKSSLKCKVLFMGSCSSRVHFFKALDRRRTAVKSACLFYLTGEVCSAAHGKNFVEQVFKGVDPTGKKGRLAMVKALNGFSDAGLVGFY